MTHRASENLTQQRELECGRWAVLPRALSGPRITLVAARICLHLGINCIVLFYWGKTGLENGKKERGSGNFFWHFMGMNVRIDRSQLIEIELELVNPCYYEDETEIRRCNTGY
jgi:hypothetical protein